MHVIENINADAETVLKLDDNKLTIVNRAKATKKVVKEWLDISLEEIESFVFHTTGLQHVLVKRKNGDSTKLTINVNGEISKAIKQIAFGKIDVSCAPESRLANSMTFFIMSLVVFFITFIPHMVIKFGSNTGSLVLPDIVAKAIGILIIIGYVIVCGGAIAAVAMMAKKPKGVRILNESLGWSEV